ncbi:MAG TPA: hypothetical protein PKO07_14970 [Pseudomonadota bacterium]|nr:hypothetical protein [Pseudomonadota bacterium]
MSKPPPSQPRAPGPATPPESPEQTLMATMVRRAHEFTLPALLDALQAVGLRAEEVIFRSHLSHSHQAYLVYSVEFLGDPRRAVVTLNIGLLAAQSPLPSYFFSVLERGGHNTEALLAVLYLIDHPLLRERARSEYPERDRRTVSDWEHAKGLLLRLLAPQSPRTLHWLFQRVFPELGLSVERATSELPLATDQVIIGTTALGESRALGGQVRLSHSALTVTLYCEEAESLTGRPWTQEGARRLQQFILPLLRESALYLQLWMAFTGRDALARLSSSHRKPDGFLGHEPLSRAVSQPSPPEHSLIASQSSQRVLLFSGYTDSRDL